MFEFESSLSPPPLLVLSLLIHLSPRANVYHLLPTLMGRMPLRLTPRRLPSSHLSHPHPLTPSSSSLASITISLGSSPQERVSISLPLPLALPVPSSYLRRGFFFFLAPPPPLVTLEFLYHPLASSFCPCPRSCLRSCASKLGMYITSYFR